MIVRKTDRSATVGDSRQHVPCRAGDGQLFKCPVPDQMRLVDSLARSGVGKLNKKALREEQA